MTNTFIETKHVPQLNRSQQVRCYPYQSMMKGVEEQTSARSSRRKRNKCGPVLSERLTMTRAASEGGILVGRYDERGLCIQRRNCGLLLTLGRLAERSKYPSLNQLFFRPWLSWRGWRGDRVEHLIWGKKLEERS